jgi:cytochrome b subunit of formate dehydrogenase
LTLSVPQSFILTATIPKQGEDIPAMKMNVVKWCVDLGLGIAFLLAAVTGIFKFAILMRIPGQAGMLLPMALMSEIHDRAGIILSVLVAVHLFLNRSWILSMTKTMLNGRKGTD